VFRNAYAVFARTASLFDSSPATIAGHAVSSGVARPSWRSLSCEARPIRFSAGVVWAAFEMPKAGPQYRAGIEFYDADADGVTRFIETNKKK